MTSPRQRTARPGPGNGCRQTISSGRPSCRPSWRTSSLNKIAKRFDQLEAELGGQAADVVMQLDRGGRPVGRGAAFDHVGVKRALREKLRVVNLESLVGEALDERVADDPAFFLRIGDAGQPAQKSAFRFHDVQIGFEVAGELVDDRLLFVLAQQAVVDEDARELRADRSIQERGHDGRIDAARQPADHAMTCPLRSRTRAMVCSAKSPSRHVPVQPQTFVRKFARIVLPSGVCVTSG